MEILKYPHPILMQKCLPLKRVDSELLNMIEEMFTLMYETKGVGLAANQVGLPYRFFVINPSGDPEKKEQQRVFINPEITLGSGKPLEDEEGCLSFPEIYSPVLRAPKVTVRAYDEKGNEIRETFEGFIARIIQHEYDHLDGISFVHRLNEDEYEEIRLDLQNMETDYAKKKADGEILPDSEITAQVEMLLKKWA
ncbi:MAG: peptide deformylase [Planctomycetia bacterium]|nr:peptide deformylase [Planctomycetia bacterium]